MGRLPGAGLLMILLGSASSAWAQRDTTPPALTGSFAYQSDGTWVIYVNERLDLDSTPVKEAFVVQIGDVDWDLSAVRVSWYGPASLNRGSIELTLSPLPTVAQRQQVWTLVYAPPSEDPLRDLEGNLMKAFETSWGNPPDDGGGAPPPPEPEPEPEPEPDPDPDPEPELPCPSRLAPYWHGTGGFAVRPADGESATVRLECAGKSYTSREHAGDDGLIVRTVSQPMCTDDDGRPLEGEMTFEGIDGDGWYWVNGDRNVAVAPLVCESQLNPELRPPVPGGVTARPSGDRRFVLSVRGTWHGTLMVHDETGFMGIVPHLVDLEGDGEHVAPYWKGGGGIVGRPLDGNRATVRLACGEADAESRILDVGEDGLVVELLPGCFDEDGAAVSGRLEADGLEDGAWYWLNTGTASAAAPLLRRGADVDLTTPVLPAGVDVEEGPLGTLFSRGALMGVVPRLEVREQ